MNLQELLKLAEAATPGPWNLSSDGEHITQTAHITRDVWYIPHREADMPYIAAMSPERIIALCRVALAARAIRSVQCDTTWKALDAALKRLEGEIS